MRPYDFFTNHSFVGCLFNTLIHRVTVLRRICFFPCLQLKVSVSNSISGGWLSGKGRYFTQKQVCPNSSEITMTAQDRPHHTSERSVVGAMLVLGQISRRRMPWSARGGWAFTAPLQDKALLSPSHSRERYF